jgi:hypothetical protein
MLSIRDALSLFMLSCFSILLQPCLGTAQYLPLMTPLDDSTRDPAVYTFGSTFQVLGPFQIGTRGMSAFVAMDLHQRAS